jgi:hypothetical protein
LVNADGREYTEVQAEGADKVPASEKEKQIKMTTTMMMMMGDGNGERDGDEEEDGDDDDEIVDVDRMDGGSSTDGRGGNPGAVT